MDITFQTENGCFNYRACGVILREQELLAMKDDRSPYYYLPGGRVQVGETAEQAVLREMEEELGIQCQIQRPLWLNQAFFTEVVSGRRYHELCLYFLMDVSQTDLGKRGDCFTYQEGKRTHQFRWIPFHRLEEEYLYPVFIRKQIFHLPEQLEIRTEWE